MIQTSWYCSACRSTADSSFDIEWRMVCPSCGRQLELMVPDGVDWNAATTDLPGVFRYLPLLPVSGDAAGKIIQEGGEVVAPVDAPMLAEKLGVDKVLLLPCVYGQSGTFKDAEAAVMIAKWLEWGCPAPAVSWHSTGNTARAYRAYARTADLTSYSFFPLDCLEKWRGESQHPDHLLIAYDGPFQEIAAIARSFAERVAATHLAPLHWKIEGKAALGYWMAEFVPDATCICQTIAGGYGAIGVHKAYERLRSWGMRSAEMPRLELLQIEGADTISHLIGDDREITTTDLRLPVNPFEPTLQSTNPLSTFNVVRRIVRQTGSSVSTVAVAEVEAEAATLTSACEEVGVPISYVDEKSPYISWAGLVNAGKRERLRDSDVIVMVVTGAYPRSGETPQPDLVLHSEL